MDKNFTNRLIFLLSLAGLGISSYLLYTYLSDSPILCLNSGCEIVRASPYSKFFGLPLPVYGAVAYLIIFLLSFLRTLVQENFEANLKKAILLFASAGVIVSAYLTYLEAFKIKAFCMWCVFSAIVICLLFITSAFEMRKNK